MTATSWTSTAAARWTRRWGDSMRYALRRQGLGSLAGVFRFGIENFRDEVQAQALKGSGFRLFPLLLGFGVFRLSALHAGRTRNPIKCASRKHLKH